MFKIQNKEHSYDVRTVYCVDYSYGKFLTATDWDEIEWANDQEYIKYVKSSGAIFECDLEPSPEWVAVYCRECHQPIPITIFYYLTHGATGWRCPRCTIIKRMREIE